MGECGKLVTVKGRPSRCWRRAEHAQLGGHTPDGYYTPTAGPDRGKRIDDRPDALRLRNRPSSVARPVVDELALTEEELDAGRRLREQARARITEPLGLGPVRELPTEREALAAGYEAAELATEAVDEEWRREVELLVRRLAADTFDRGSTFTANDVWRLGLADPPGGNRRALGGVIMAAARAGLVRKAGTGATSLHGHGASNLAVWAGTASAVGR